MPKIDKPSERELMKKKRERGEKKKVGKTRSPRNANIRVAGARPPGTFENARSCPSTLLRNFFRETRPIERRSKFAKFGNSSLVLYEKKKIDRIHGFIVPRKPSESILSINVSRLFSFTAYFFYLSEKCLPP